MNRVILTMSKGKGHVPIRSCISCGKKRAKGELVRLVIDNQGNVQKDHSGSLPGRGAYVCARKECWEQLERGNRLKRAFRKKGELRLHPSLRRWGEDSR